MKTPHFLVHDRRGAVLVVGLLASVLLLGVLWTLMGVGESIAFRERGQTAADAVAFSTSVIQARAMNLVVLFNLLMAAILVVRVILNGIWMVATLLAPFTFGVTGEVAADVWAIREEIDPEITAAIDGLGKAGMAVQWMNSSFATGTANYVARAYTPVVSSVLVTSDGVNVGEEGISPMPLKQASYGGPLCAKAVGTIGDVIDALLQPMGIDGVVHPVLGWIMSPLETIAAAMSPLLCEIDVNVNAPQDPLDQTLQNGAQQCKDQVKKSGLKPGSQEYKDKMKQCDFKGDEYDSVKNTLLTTLLGLIGINPPQQLEIIPDWKNGYGQTIAVATLNTSLLKGNLALFGVSSSTAVPKGAGTAIAQSEYYYDCEGKWSDPDCNGTKTPLGPGEAMWNFRWRARLVAVDTQSAVVKQFTDPMTADYQSALSKGGDGQTVQFFQSFSNYVEH
jgi:hypothetical protein